MSDQQWGVTVWASQLMRNDFPPVCAMTGRPAETWRRFTFGGLAGHLPLTRRSSRRMTLSLWGPIGLVGLAVLLWIAAIVLGATSASMTYPVRQALVYASWTEDPAVTAGPHPGFRPVLSDITGRNITNAGVTKDTNGTDWDMELQFDSGGASRIASLSRTAIAACPGDVNSDPNASCAKRYLSIWLGLTQDDIAHWTDSYYAADISKPVGSGCINLAASNLCGKLVFDSSIDQPLDGGDIVYPIGTKQEAQDVVNAIQSPSGKELPLGAFIAWGLAGLGVLLAVAGVVGLVVVRRLIGPRGFILQQVPGYYDSLVEIRNVHPAFVAAVTSIQQARGAPSSISPSPSQPPQAV